MTIDLYPGSAGGQPRLTLPEMSLDPSDPQFAMKWNRQFRTLLTWANSLLMGGGGSLAAFAKYSAAVVGGSTNPVTWTPGISSGFSYFDGGVQHLQSFPTDSLTLALYGYDIVNGSGIVPSGPDVQAQLGIEDSGATVVSDLWASYRNEESGGGTPLDFGTNPMGFTTFESTSLPGTPPYHFVAHTNALPTMGAVLSLISWSLP